MPAALEVYRLIGIRSDGTQHLLSMRLSLDDALWLRGALKEAGIFSATGIFPEVVIEPDRVGQSLSDLGGSPPAASSSAPRQWAS
jgi:hypothetical protein